MKEFGSDFHLVDNYEKDSSPLRMLNASFYANGRQALGALIENNAWKRIWVPEYFCYDVLEYIRDLRIEIVFYNEYPISLRDNQLKDLPFKPDDILLRMNYFGLSNWQDSSEIPVEVIEDHSHDLLGDWAQKSNADWCIASLRKTIPIPEGGILWSPNNKTLPDVPESTQENEDVSSRRMSAMSLKRNYLLGETISKDEIRHTYIETENELVNLKTSALASSAFQLLKQFDIEKWYAHKKTNWAELSSLNSKAAILKPEDPVKNNPFSVVLVFDDNHQRDVARQRLIEQNIYPAILWPIPEDRALNIRHFSNTMLSIPCDARYTLDEIKEVKSRIEKILEEVYD